MSAEREKAPSEGGRENPPPSASDSRRRKLSTPLFAPVVIINDDEGSRLALRPNCLSHSRPGRESSSCQPFHRASFCSRFNSPPRGEFYSLSERQSRRPGSEAHDTEPLTGKFQPIRSLVTPKTGKHGNHYYGRSKVGAGSQGRGKGFSSLLFGLRYVRAEQMEIPLSCARRENDFYSRFLGSHGFGAELEDDAVQVDLARAENRRWEVFLWRGKRFESGREVSVISLHGERRQGTSGFPSRMRRASSSGLRPCPRLPSRLSTSEVSCLGSKRGLARAWWSECRRLRSSFRSQRSTG